MTNCNTCDGTGKIVVAKSWFPADGFRKVRCGVCSGTGESTYRCSAYEAEQGVMRAKAF